jgi:hypothetical protein
MFGALITDESLNLSPKDLNWIHRIKTNNITGKQPGQKKDEWYDDQSEEARKAGGRYYMTYEETQRRIANGQAPPFVKAGQYTSVMWDVPRRNSRDKNDNTKYVNTTWTANLSLVNVKNNDSSLIIFMYGFSITKGVLNVTEPTVIKKSN